MKHVSQVYSHMMLGYILVHDINVTSKDPAVYHNERFLNQSAVRGMQSEAYNQMIANQKNAIRVVQSELPLCDEMRSNN